MSGKSAVERVRRLRGMLLSLLRQDLAAIGEGVPDVLRFADDADAPRARDKGAHTPDRERVWYGHMLLQEGGGAQRMQLSLLLRLLTCSRGEETLRRLNPCMHGARVETTMNVCAVGIEPTAR